MIREEDFTYQTRLKGKTYGTTKITNNSDYIVFYKGEFVGEVQSKKAAISFIKNLVKYQKLTYTQTYK